MGDSSKARSFLRLIGPRLLFGEEPERVSHPTVPNDFKGAFYYSVHPTRPPFRAALGWARPSPAGATNLFAIDIDIAGEHTPKDKRLPETYEEALGIYMLFPTPSLIVRTSKGGGMHMLWVLSQTVSVSSASTWARYCTSTASEAGYHIDYLGDAKRILRLPGSDREDGSMVSYQRVGGEVDPNYLLSLVPNKVREPKVRSSISAYSPSIYSAFNAVADPDEIASCVGLEPSLRRKGEYCYTGPEGQLKRGAELKEDGALMIFSHSIAEKIGLDYTPKPASLSELALSQGISLREYPGVLEELDRQEAYHTQVIETGSIPAGYQFKEHAESTILASSFRLGKQPL